MVGFKYWIKPSVINCVFLVATAKRASGTTVTAPLAIIKPVTVGPFCVRIWGDKSK